MLFAYDAQIDGIYYNLNSENKTAEVTHDGAYSNSNGAGYTQSEVVIPEKVTYDSVEYSVTSIGIYAFYKCSSLTSVTIPNSVTSIGSNAFYSCSSLDSIVVESITPPTLGSYIVSNKKDVYIYIPNGTKSAYQTAWGSDYVFINNETSVTINVETPGTLSDLIFDAGTRPAFVVKLVVTGTLNSADFTCMRATMSSLIDVDLSGITNTSGVNFYNKSNLVRIVLPKNLTSLGSLSYYEDGVFEDCSSLKSIIIPDGVITIGYDAFRNCDALKSIVIPNNVKTIGRYAFSSCSYLKSLTIGNSVTSIEEYAFSYSYPDTIIFSGATPPSASNLGLSASSCKLIVPTEAYNDYLRHSYWGQFLTIWNTKVTTSVNNTEWGTVTGSGYYTEKDNVNLTAIPKVGYHFVKWSDGNTDNPRSFVVTQDSTFTAEFAINKYTITIPESENGIVIGMGEYNHGDTITLTATPNEHYHFVQWSDGNTENPRIFVATNDTTLSAEFAIDKHEVVLLGENGTLYGRGSYAYGDSVEIKAVANDGYNFIRWSDGNTENPRSLVITQDTTFSAIFAMNVSKLELDADISLSSSSVTMTSYFYISTTVENVGENDFYGDLAIGLYDLNEKFITAIEPSATTIAKDASSSVSIWNWSEEVVIPVGRYYVGVVYKVGNDWRLIKSSNYTSLKSLSVTYTDALELYSFSISQNKLYSYGSIDVTIDILNTSYETFYGSYRVSLCKLDGTVIKNLGVKNENNGLGYNYHYTNGLTFSSTLSVEPGLYVLQVGYKRSGTDSWYYIGTSYVDAPVFIEVLDPNAEEEKPILKDEYESNDLVDNAYYLSYQLENDSASIALSANIHNSESVYSKDKDYYNIRTEEGYYYEIDVVVYDKYNQNEEYNLTGDVAFRYIYDSYSSDQYDDCLEYPISLIGGANLTICVEPYTAYEVGTYELEINIKRTKLQYYEVNAIAQDSIMGRVYGSGTYSEYDLVYLEAVANEHYHFVRWSDGNTDNPRFATLTQDTTFVAEFEANYYDVLVYELDGNGTGTVTGAGVGVYQYGDTATLTAIPGEESTFLMWSDGNTENPRNIVVEDNIYLGVIFELNQYEVTVVAQDSIIGVVEGSGMYYYGTEVTIEAVANEGYHFVKWSDGNTENPRIIIVKEDITLSAEFELDRTPVDNIDDSSVMIYVQNGMLYIEGVEIDYNVFDASGRLIYTGRDAQLSLPRGVYMIVMGNQIQKVVL